ncbi:HAD family hydrolase [Candidatus Pacearchaeota archaeon]|nr:HAD family hydrolase [Candidatus Pacearchaeota archaeon]
MIKAIVFDFDGVLLDTYENHYQTYAKKYQDLDRETHKRLFEGNIHEMRSKLVVKDEALDYPSILRKHLLGQGIEDNIPLTLNKLQKKFPLFIITSHRESILKKFFEKQNLSDLFDDILGFETHKKKEVKFQYLFEKYNLNKDNILFVTDTLGDILAANKLGIKTIAVDFGFHERWRLEKGKPLKIISQFEEILSLV